jgi:2,4-diaminopentanoate dehydrogenase
MANKKLKVVVIGTGNIGGIAVRVLQGREDVQLVGVWGRAKNIGLDAGLLDTDTPCGVIITNKEEDIFSLKPDCAIMALNLRDPREAQVVNGEWFIKLLERGINVVTASDGGLVYPPAHVDQEYVARIEAAARKGNVTFYMNGQEPGFVEHMALLAATLSNTIKRITSYELFYYNAVREREEMASIFGFDEPIDKTAILEMKGVQLSIWGNPITNVAHKLGYQVERYEELYEKRVTDKDISVGFGVIKAGKVAAVRIRTSAIVAGREAVVVEHVNRMCEGIAPEWEKADTVGCMRIKIEGDPNVSMDCSIGDPAKPGELGYDGYLMTVMRIVNAIPFVCAAPAGITTFRDLPLTTPSNAFRSEATYVDHKILKATTTGP